jgi:predicted metal-dependent HD superfamily phosphohydrolase
MGRVEPSRGKNLAERWVGLALRVSGRADPAGCGARLLAAWSQPHRSYHTAQHLTEVLDRIDEIVASDRSGDTGRDADPVRLAAWFHDAVYDPRRQDNEEASAALAARELRDLAVADRVVSEAARLILLTASHDPAPHDAMGALLCDADLAVLASPPARYAEYAQQVRREYRHLPDAAFARGRADVLDTLLAGGPVFHTAPGRRWERAARSNIRWELSVLGVPSPPPPDDA